MGSCLGALTCLHPLVPMGLCHVTLAGVLPSLGL